MGAWGGREYEVWRWEILGMGVLWVGEWEGGRWKWRGWEMERGLDGERVGDGEMERWSDGEMERRRKWEMERGTWVILRVIYP